MRKLLSILGSCLITGSAAVPVVSCSQLTNDKTPVTDQQYAKAITMFWTDNVIIRIQKGQKEITGQQIHKLLSTFGASQLVKYLPENEDRTNFSMQKVQINVGDATFMAGDTVHVTVTYGLSQPEIADFNVLDNAATAKDYTQAVQKNIFGDNFNIFTDTQLGYITKEAIIDLFKKMINENATSAKMAEWCDGLNISDYSIDNFAISVTSSADQFKNNDNVVVELTYSGSGPTDINKQVQDKAADNVDYANAISYVLDNKFNGTYLLPAGKSSMSITSIKADLDNVIPKDAISLITAVGEHFGHKDYNQYNVTNVQFDISVLKGDSDEIADGQSIKVIVNYQDAKAELTMNVKCAKATDQVIADAVETYLNNFYKDKTNYSVSNDGIAQEELEQDILGNTPSVNNLPTGYDYTGYDKDAISLVFNEKPGTIYKPGTTISFAVKYQSAQSTNKVTLKLILANNDLSSYRLPASYTVAKTDIKIQTVGDLKTKLINDFATIVQKKLDNIKVEDIKISSLKDQKGSELNDTTVLKNLDSKSLTVVFAANSTNVVGTSQNTIAVAFGDLKDLPAIFNQEFNILDINPNSDDAINKLTNDIYNFIKNSDWWDASEDVVKDLSIKIKTQATDILPNQPLDFVVSSNDLSNIVGDPVEIKTQGVYIADFTHCKSGYTIKDGTSLNILDNAYVMSENGFTKPAFDSVLKDSYWQLTNLLGNNSIGLDYLRFDGQSIRSLEDTLNLLQGNNDYMLQIPGAKDLLSQDGTFELPTLYLLGLKDYDTTNLPIKDGKTNALNWELRLVKWHIFVKNHEIDLTNTSYTIDGNTYELPNVISQF